MFKKCIITILGRTNVGKSTLFNKLINKKISITSKKKNTTQNIFLNINNIKNKQYIYLDTPGFNNYKNFIKIFHKIKKFIKNKYIKKINLIILIIEKKNFFYEIQAIKKINYYKIPIIILINKIDKIKNKLLILPFIKNIKKYIKYKWIIPISIKKNKYIKIIKNIIDKYLIKSKKYINFKKNNSYNDEFIILEIIREKILRLMGDEIPYIIKIKKKKIIFKKKNINIYCYLIIKKIKYKKILIGKKGKKIKKIIFLSKKSIEKYFKYKKNIKLFLYIKK